MKSIEKACYCRLINFVSLFWWDEKDGPELRTCNHEILGFDFRDVKSEQFPFGLFFNVYGWERALLAAAIRCVV